MLPEGHEGDDDRGEREARGRQVQRPGRAEHDELDGILETTLARRRELGAREEVDELIKAHALTRAIARRMKGLDTMPMSPEALAEALKRGDGSMSREARRAEAAAMRGAFPGNRPCPCGSTKKFKRCCGA